MFRTLQLNITKQKMSLDWLDLRCIFLKKISEKQNLKKESSYIAIKIIDNYLIKNKLANDRF